MKKLLAIVLVSLIVTSPIFSATLTTTPVSYEYVPYEAGEFPEWAMELRRAESIFFGSFVITMPLAMGAYSLALSLGANGSGNTGTDMLYQVAGAACASGLIALIDWIIGEMRGDD